MPLELYGEACEVAGTGGCWAKAAQFGAVHLSCGHPEDPCQHVLTSSLSQGPCCGTMGRASLSSRLKRWSGACRL